MTIEVLAKQGRKQIYNGLAGIDSAKLKKMRNDTLRTCFNRMDEMRYRREFVARIHGKTFVNDAASRSINSTWYTLESIEGPIIWIVNADGPAIDATKLLPSVRNRVRMMVCVGKNSEWLHRQFDSVVPVTMDTANIHEAVTRAFYNPIEEATVVFSPMVASQQSATDEGIHFHHEVNDL